MKSVQLLNLFARLLFDAALHQGTGGEVAQCGNLKQTLIMRST